MGKRERRNCGFSVEKGNREGWGCGMEKAEGRNVDGDAVGVMKDNEGTGWRRRGWEWDQQNF